MEQHPVPQNIIDVEFKLFGSFTLKQFSKIIIGCLAGVVVYFLPIIPLIIKVPMIIIVVGAGILAALINNFGVWLNGFLKALFISPRYVWIKKEAIPESLRTKQAKEVKKTQRVSAGKNHAKIDIADVSMEKLFGTKSKRDDYLELENEYENDPVRSNNLDRLYSQAFSGAQNQPVKKKVTDLVQENNSLLANYQKQIDELKYGLMRLNKDEHYKAKEQEIISRINDLYREIKLLQMQEGAIPIGNQRPAIQQPVIAPANNAKSVLGIVVDKNDRPISRAGIIFENIQTHGAARAISSADGKFTTPLIPIGKYNIHIEHPGYKFHSYQVDLRGEKMPAYKFREK